MAPSRVSIPPRLVDDDLCLWFSFRVARNFRRRFRRHSERSRSFESEEHCKKKMGGDKVRKEANGLPSVCESSSTHSSKSSNRSSPITGCAGR